MQEAPAKSRTAWTVGWLAAAAGLLVVLHTSLLPAQFAANVSPDHRVNNYLYDGGFQGTVRYTGPINLLPSEMRYARWRSGEMPSETRAREMAVGPLAAGGNIAYAPPLPPEAAQLAGARRSAGAFSRTAVSAATPSGHVPMGMAAGSPGGNVRYGGEGSGVAVPANNLAAAPLSGEPGTFFAPGAAFSRPMPRIAPPPRPMRVNPELVPDAGSMIEGSIRYGTRIRP